MTIHSIILILVTATALAQFSLAKRFDCSASNKCSSCECTSVARCGGDIYSGDEPSRLPIQQVSSCMNCKWLISVSRNKRVRLTFSQFVLGPGDKVQIFNGHLKKSLRIVTYREGDRAVDVVSSGNTMTVIVITDGCGPNNTLINASFKATDCGNLYYLKPGKVNSKQIQSPNFPRQYSNNLDCLWMFVGSESSLLSAFVRIESFSTAEPSDKLIIQNSLETSRSESKVNEYHGAKRPKKRLLRFRNTPGFTIRFLSDGTKRGKGFSLKIDPQQQVFGCSTPKRPINGVVTLKNFRRTAKFACCNGYKLYGNEERHCTNRRWEPLGNPTCKQVKVCTLPPNVAVLNRSSTVTIGEEVNLSCTKGYKLSNSRTVLSAFCDCNGKWNITIDLSTCQRNYCLSPPPSPRQGGMTHGNNLTTYPPGSRVNYSCPDGYGLDGIPYRVCTEGLVWEPSTSIHTCEKNLSACADPGLPENGIRKIKSFRNGRIATFGCKVGFTYYGSVQRTCHADDPKNAFWDGKEGYCKSDFKSPSGLAIQLTETFTNRLISCVSNNDDREIAITNTTISTPTLSTPKAFDNDFIESSNCRGRSVLVGESCIDLIYLADCSRSVGKENFNHILDYVGRSASLFDINGGIARVTLITYDSKVYPRIELGRNRTLLETIKLIETTKFCGGATATRKVLKYVREKVMPLTRRNCTKAIFLFSDGENNWAGDPLTEANALKQEKGVEIYTMAFGVTDTDGNSKVNKRVLEQLASKPNYYFLVEKPIDIANALKQTFKTKVDYCKECGTTLAPDCKHRQNGVCFSERGAWPWMVAIYKLSNGNPVFHCGGAIISDCMVLTAAHCVHGYLPENLLVVAGETERNVKEFSEKTYTVEKILVHNEYNKDTYNRDIGLIQLSCNATCTPYVRKICLPTAQDIKLYTPGTKCVVAGWGATEERDINGPRTAKVANIKELHLPIADKATCITSMSPEFRSGVTNYTVCGGDGSGSNDACDGDSGGPLFCKREKESEIDDDQYVVVGIVSWGEGCGQARKYGIYTHLLNLMDWVRLQLITNPCKLAPVDGEEKEQCPKPPFSLH